MNIRDVRGYYEKISEIASDVTFRSRTLNKAKSVLLSIFKLIIIVGMSYIILGPVINIVSNSFFSPSDVYNPSVFMIPLSPTLENFKRAFTRLNYWSTLGYTMVYIVSITLIQISFAPWWGMGLQGLNSRLKNFYLAVCDSYYRTACPCV